VQCLAEGRRAGARTDPGASAGAVQVGGNAPGRVSRAARRARVGLAEHGRAEHGVDGGIRRCRVKLRAEAAAVSAGGARVASARGSRTSVWSPQLFGLRKRDCDVSNARYCSPAPVFHVSMTWVMPQRQASASNAVPRALVKLRKYSGAMLAAKMELSSVWSSPRGSARLRREPSMHGPSHAPSGWRCGGPSAQRCDWAWAQRLLRRQPASTHRRRGCGS
jgi:hypothetical protein